MSFTRIQNEAKQAAERAFDRYVALLQQERDWTPAEEAEMRALGEELGKGLAEMTADRQVIARAQSLQKTIALKPGLGQKQAAAWRVVKDHDAETAGILKQRRAEYSERYEAARKLDETWIRVMTAERELVKLVQAQPLLLGDVSALS